MESNDSPEIPDRGETSDIPGLPSGCRKRQLIRLAVGFTRQNSAAQSVDHQHSGVSPMCPCTAVLTDRCVLWTDSQPDVSTDRCVIHVTLCPRTDVLANRRVPVPTCLQTDTDRCIPIPTCLLAVMSTYSARCDHVPTCLRTDVSLYQRTHGPMYPCTDVLTDRCVHVLGPV